MTTALGSVPVLTLAICRSTLVEKIDTESSSGLTIMTKRSSLEMAMVEDLEARFKIKPVSVCVFVVCAAGVTGVVAAGVV